MLFAVYRKVFFLHHSIFGKLILYYFNLVILMDKCRICLQIVSGKVTDLFCDGENSKEILHRIFLCSQVKIYVTKFLPRMICNECHTDLTLAYNFRLKCIKADSYAFASSQEKELVPTSYGSQKVDITEQLQQIHNEASELKTIPSLSVVKHKDVVIETKSYDLKGSLIKIQAKNSSRKSSHYCCSKCPYKTPYSQTLVNHYRKHSGEKPYHCYCGKKFSQAAGLAAHKKTHSNVTCCTCSICGKQFKHNFSLKKHLQVHEDGSFSCGVCEKSLKSLKSLQSHLNRHNNVRNYNCEDCGATFVTSSELINHRKTHNADKKIECNFCGYKTHTKKVMILHLKRHAGDKRYNCSTCDVACYTKGELQTHLRVHTREKPYSCPVCCQKFRHSPSVNKHMRNVHRLTFKWGDAKMKNYSQENVKTNDY